ncbi:MAG: zeta toxin family protein [Cyclobacteriaceae bacterium]|jgi:predicted ABC-type ATPase|nr:zeta toxin family protein [Flammeovirgaceae bacterium]
MPSLYVVAGPNGVGKSTLFNAIIPEGIDYINADLIVNSLREQSGGNNIQDIANQEVSSLFYSKIKKNESFALETNLSDIETYKSFIGIQSLHYEVNVFFLSVEPVEICIERVNQRVKQGGHNVNANIIRFQNERICNWAAEVISQESTKSDSFSSIEDVRKNYKPKS